MAQGRSLVGTLAAGTKRNGRAHVSLVLHNYRRFNLEIIFWTELTVYMESNS